MTEANEIELKGHKINLTRLGIKFKLNEQQYEALNRITDFLIDKNELSFTLMGYAGTGKTSIVKILLKWIDLHFNWYDYTITAPTHRAKYVIEALSGTKSNTIHSILGLMPNVNLEKLDNRNVQFNASKEPKMPKNLLILDEASMINDTLFNLIIDKVRYKDSQVLFIGDPAQLKPVKQVHISKVFELGNKYELTKVERQQGDNPLGLILDTIRNNIWSEEQLFPYKTNLNSKNEGIVCFSSSQEFLAKSKDDIEAIFNGDYLNSRILAFSNDKVQLYNKLIKKRFGLVDEYSKGSLLMAYDNVGGDEGIINSCDYIIDTVPKKAFRYITGVQTIGWEVDLVSTDKKSFVTQFILSEENEDKVFEEIGFKIEEMRNMAIFHAKDRFQRLKYWKMYYAALESFISVRDVIFDGRVIKPKSIDHGFAHTIHKSQGGSYSNVSVDIRDVGICKAFDIQQYNQLLYVSLSRTMQVANLLC